MVRRCRPCCGRWWRREGWSGCEVAASVQRRGAVVGGGGRASEGAVGEVKVYNLYGPTEATIDSDVKDVGERSGMCRSGGRWRTRRCTFWRRVRVGGSGSQGRGVHRRGGVGERVLEQGGADGGEIHPEPVQHRGRSEAVPDGRHWTLSHRRGDRVSGQDRPSGEGARVQDRVRRDRECAV